jgi:hypothetical protein
MDYSDIINQAGQQYNVDPALLRAVMGQESGGNPSAISPKGASGLMQLMPATAKQLGVTDINDPQQNIMAGAKYLSQQLDKYQDIPTALAAYNAGPGAVDKAGGIPNFPETQGYVKNIMAKYQPQSAADQPQKAQAKAAPDLFADARANAQGNQGPNLFADAAKQAQGNAAPNAQPVAPNQTPQQQYDPTQGMSTTQKLLAGAGKSVVDMGHGITQLGAEGLNAISPSLVSNQTVQNLRQQEDERKQLDAPLMNTGAGTTGYIGGALATSLLPAGIVAKGAEAANLARTANVARTVLNPNTYKAAATIGALQGAAAPVGTEDSRTTNALLGGAAGAAGNAIVNTVGRVAQPIQNALSSGQQKAVQVLQQAGIPLDAAQMSGSPILNRLKSGFSDNPFTLGGQKAQAATQQEGFNKAVLNTIGSDANAATQDVMGAAKARIGQVFNDVAERNPIAYDNTLDAGLTNIAQGAKSELNQQQYGVIQNQLNNVLQKAEDGNMSINGRAYQNIKSSLDRISGGNDQALGYWARQLRGTLDDGLERAAQSNQGDYQALVEARQQWGNMRKIEGAIDKDGNGDISPARLAGIMGQKANRAQSVYGQGNTQLSDLAQAGRNMLTEKLPNSGTPARILANLAIPVAAGAIGTTANGDLGSGLGYAATAYALPRAAQAIIQSPRLANYLANGMNNGVMRNVLTAPNTNPLIGGATRMLPNALGNALKGPQ